jgi:hypothetical protein
LSLRNRLSAVTAVTAAVAIAGPVAAGAAAPSFPAPGTSFPTPPTSFPTPGTPDPNFCVKGTFDPGPFGPDGPYGPKGPYGPDGPLSGKPNPLGDAATCGGLFTYIVRGGDLTSFVNGNLSSVGITPPS